MAEKQCRMDFSCAALLQQSELQVEDCPNLTVCRNAQSLEALDSDFLAAESDRRYHHIVLGSTRSGKSVIASTGLME